MRFGSFCVATLVGVLAVPVSAQAALLTITADKASYEVGETITITVIGDSQGALTTSFVFGTIEYDRRLVSPVGGQTQKRLKTGGGSTWNLGTLLVDLPHADTQDSFSQFKLGTIPYDSTRKLTAVMQFSTIGIGEACFSWYTEPGWEALRFFGLTDAPSAGVSIDSGVAPDCSSGAGGGSGGGPISLDEDFRFTRATFPWYYHPSACPNKTPSPNFSAFSSQNVCYLSSSGVSSGQISNRERDIVYGTWGSID